MKREYAFFFISFVAVAILSLPVTGCKQTAKWPETSTVQTQEEQEEEKTLDKYHEYLLLMNEYERMEFFKLTTDDNRDRFLQSEGIQQKKYLHDCLVVGMPMEKVEAIKDLGKPLKTEVEVGTDGRKTMWIYDVFNRYRHLRYVIAFQNNKVADWDVWLP